MFVRVTICSWKSFERTFLTVRLLYKHIKKENYGYNKIQGTTG